MSTPGMPRSVAWLGYGGLLPFVGLALATLLDRQRNGAWQQLSYFNPKNED